MNDHDLELAVAAALKAGLTTVEEIVQFVIERAAPMVHVELRERATEEEPSQMMSAKVIVARPSGATH